MTHSTDGGLDDKFQAPGPLGYGQAGAAAYFVAAPLLTAADLSLAGVVAASADKAFGWPGATLLVLVAAGVCLIASIQLGYHARRFLYSFSDLEEWHSPTYVAKRRATLHRRQGEDFKRWEKLNGGAVFCFNAGTVLLGLGIAAALIPGDDSRQVVPRWIAAGVVAAASLADLIWTIRLNREAREGEQ